MERISSSNRKGNDMRQSANYNLNLYDGSDLFNPLSVENTNTEAIDEQMKVNADYSVPKATAIKAGTVHNITRTNKDASMFHFTATSEYTAGETFTVDGNIVSVETSSGDSLQTGAFVIGAEVLCCLVGSIMTVFSSAGVDLSDINASTLEGHPASYFATDQALSVTNAAAVSAGEMALSNKNRIDLIESSSFTESKLIDSITSNGTFNLSDNINNYKMIIIDVHDKSSGGNIVRRLCETNVINYIINFGTSGGNIVRTFYCKIEFTSTSITVSDYYGSAYSIDVVGIK